jgi:hypothetical protein
VLIASAFSHNSSGYKAFLAGMYKYEHPDTSSGEGASITDAAISGWVGITAFAQVVSKVTGPITRASVLSAISTTSNLTTDGLTPPMNLTTPNPTPGYERLFDPWAISGENYANGAFTDQTPVRFISVLGDSKTYTP